MRNLLFAVLIVSLGCDDSSSGTGRLAACGAFTPCEGSVVGTWSITKNCSDPTTVSSSSSNCTTEVDMGNVQLSGTFNFTSAGSYSSAGSVNGTATFTYSQGCLTAMNKTCAQLGSSIGSSVSLSCVSDAAGDCNCTEAITQFPASEQGTYTTSGSSLVTTKTSSTGSTEAPTQSDYCVEGNTLKIRQTSQTSTTSGGMSILVLTRQ